MSESTQLVCDLAGRPMTPPPCNCAHLSQIVVWKRGDKAPIKQRHDRCIHPSGPHPQHEWCEWRTPKTQGAAT